MSIERELLQLAIKQLSNKTNMDNAIPPHGDVKLIERIDELLNHNKPDPVNEPEPVAFMFPSDIERFKQKEC